MIKKLLKNPSFMIGFLFLFILIVTSLLYPAWIKPHLEPPPELIYEDGKLVDQPAYPPSLTHPFGVDRLGQDTFWNVIEGAKIYIIRCCINWTFADVFRNGKWNLIWIVSSAFQLGNRTFDSSISFYSNHIDCHDVFYI